MIKHWFSDKFNYEFNQKTMGFTVLVQFKEFLWFLEFQGRNEEALFQDNNSACSHF